MVGAVTSIPKPIIGEFTRPGNGSSIFRWRRYRYSGWVSC
jgi:hypothetical protein